MKSIFEETYLRMIKEDLDDFEDLPAADTNTDLAPGEFQVCFKTTNKDFVEALQKNVSKITVVSKETDEEGEETEVPADFEVELMDLNVTGGDVEEDDADAEDAEDDEDEAEDDIEESTDECDECDECDEENLATEAKSQDKPKKEVKKPAKSDKKKK